MKRSSRAVLVVLALVLATILAGAPGVRAAPLMSAGGYIATSRAPEWSTAWSIGRTGFFDEWCGCVVWSYYMVAHRSGEPAAMYKLPGANEDSFDVELHDVEMTAHNDGWVVGSYYLARWNGQQWNRMSPQPMSDGWWLEGVSAAGRNDVYIWGYHPARETYAVWHWDGVGWTRLSGIGGHVVQIRAISSTDVWAVRNDGNSVAYSHFDGSTWRAVDSGLGGTESPYLVGATGTRYVWGYRHDMILRWDGQQWRQQEAPPIDDAPGDDGSGGDASLGGRAWYVSGASIARSSPAGWGSVRMPAICADSRTADWTDVDVAAPDDVVIVGSCTSNQLLDDTYLLAMHWNGERWSRI